MNAQFILQKTVNGVSEELDSIDVGKEQNWTHTWENLPVYENGKAVTCSVKEVLIISIGYTSNTMKWTTVSNGGSITITNTLRSDTPPTGDNSDILLWTALLILSAVGCAGVLCMLCIIFKKKKQIE